MEPEAVPTYLSFEDFEKVDIRIGRVMHAERVPETDKLIKCTVDFGALGMRTIVSGIAVWKTPEDLVGKQLPYVVNLAPRTIKGVESQGMLFAGSDDAGLFLMHPDRDAQPGSRLG